MGPISLVIPTPIVVFGPPISALTSGKVPVISFGESMGPSSKLK
ncbi:hypothetical protein LAUMK4_05806 [Mycobacterium persicum]|uniref:Uncharacterized protein n=1 Tax=Mycobacterium persicum TaxID=1487726 RepID=A0AB38V2N3_9MYCO|nr:hypothetical protein LAUMK15_05670 [Mycobacterium persicum]VAZ86724.1 hypothetical protein LAUMK42_05577 [Mycobacterium persicum]VBA32776.1 hypothetical protein LAUMK4_05806 [Mycobacterium persicum]